MRLRHKDLLIYLPKQILLGQHRECCALRGLSWNKKHYIVNYIFTHNYLKLTHFHNKVIELLIKKYHVNIDRLWMYDIYRGKQMGLVEFQDLPNINFAIDSLDYFEHNEIYLSLCLHNLKYAKNPKGKMKGIDLFEYFPFHDCKSDLGYIEEAMRLQNKIEWKELDEVLKIK